MHKTTRTQLTRTVASNSKTSKMLALASAIDWMHLKTIAFYVLLTSCYRLMDHNWFIFNGFGSHWGETFDKIHGLGGLWWASWVLGANIGHTTATIWATRWTKVVFGTKVWYMFGFFLDVFQAVFSLLFECKIYAQGPPNEWMWCLCLDSKWWVEQSQHWAPAQVGVQFCTSKK